MAYPTAGMMPLANNQAQSQLITPGGYGAMTGRGSPQAPSIGGNQNVPNLFGTGVNGGGPAGFGGYNAGMANSVPSWMGGMLSGNNGNAYGSPVGDPSNPYSGYNLTGMSANQGLGQQSSQMGYLQAIAGGQGAGAPVNQQPAWQSMIDAQNYNIHQGGDALAEQFNNGGGLFSTAYGGAQGLYQEQARVGQNAQLTAAQTQAMQAANQNQMGAAQQLSSQGYGAMGQLSNQAFQGGLAQMQNQTNLQGLQLQGLGLDSQNAYQQGQLGQQNLQTGNTLGNSQLLANQNQLTSAYQNWYNSQPQNNPLLSMMYAGATGYPQMTQPTYNPGMLGSMMQGLGGMAGGAGSLLTALGLSDRRLKTDLELIGEKYGLKFYHFKYVDQPRQTYIGVIAQEAYEIYPDAVIVGGDDPYKSPWMVNYSKLFQLAKEAA